MLDSDADVEAVQELVQIPTARPSNLAKRHLRVEQKVALDNSTGWGNPCGLTGRVTHGWGTGYDSPTRQLSNKPKNVPNG